MEWAISSVHEKVSKSWLGVPIIMSRKIRYLSDKSAHMTREWNGVVQKMQELLRWKKKRAPFLFIISPITSGRSFCPLVEKKWRREVEMGEMFEIPLSIPFHEYKSQSEKGSWRQGAIFFTLTLFSSGSLSPSLFRSLYYLLAIGCHLSRGIFSPLSGSFSLYICMYLFLYLCTVCLLVPMTV